MIDIWGDGPYFINITELAMESVQEFGQYFIHFFILAVAVLFFKRRLQGLSERMAASLLAIFHASLVFSSGIRSEFFFSLCLAAVLTVQIRILNFLPFRTLDYTFVFCAMLFPVRLFNSTSAIMGHLWIFWVLFCVLFISAKMSMGNLLGRHFLFYFQFVFLALSMYLFELGVPALYACFHRLLTSSAAALILAACLFSAALFAGAYGIRAYFKRQIEQWNALGQKYQRIERCFFSFSLLILVLFTLIYLPFTLMRMQNALITLLVPILCLFFLIAQFPFIALLLQTALYRDSDTFHKWEKEGIAAYYQELGTSITAMQEIRHDIKNIFFTMGNFVERSDDPEMKQFFWEKIYPYSEKAIRQSELLSAIYQLPAEALRAFFYLKVSQAIQQEIAVRLETAIVPEHFQTGMDIIDLTRILGILLDNAMEETVRIPGGVLDIRVACSEGGCSYVIKNPVTKMTENMGIRAGSTEKGSGHGHGLNIVRELLAQYPHASLNSVLRNGTFVQSLNLIHVKE